MSYSDVQWKMRFHLGEKQLTFNQDYEVLCEVISGALGGASKDEKVFIPQTAEEAVSQFNAMFSGK